MWVCMLAGAYPKELVMGYFFLIWKRNLKLYRNKVKIVCTNTAVESDFLRKQLYMFLFSFFHGVVSHVEAVLQTWDSWWAYPETQQQIVSVPCHQNGSDAGELHKTMFLFCKSSCFSTWERENPTHSQSQKLVKLSETPQKGAKPTMHAVGTDLSGEWTVLIVPSFSSPPIRAS